MVLGATLACYHDSRCSCNTCKFVPAQLVLERKQSWYGCLWAHLHILSRSAQITGALNYKTHVPTGVKEIHPLPKDLNEYEKEGIAKALPELASSIHKGIKFAKEVSQRDHWLLPSVAMLYL